MTLLELLKQDGVPLQGKGSQLRAECPFKNHSSEWQMSVNTDENKYHCHACGAEGGIMSYLMNKRGMSKKDAMKAAGFGKETAVRKESGDFRVTGTYIYADKDGEWIKAIKKAKPNGAKRMIYYVKASQAADWKYVASTSGGAELPPVRLLYNLRSLKDDDAMVFVVEGEGTADWLYKAIGRSNPVLSWLGGSSAWKKADWTKLRGRKVLIIPDNDDVGRACAYGIAKKMLTDKQPPKVLVCDFREGGDGDDIEDAKWGKDKIIEYIKANSAQVDAKEADAAEKNFAALAKGKPPPSEQPQSEPQPQDEPPSGRPPSELIDNAFFRIIGLNRATGEFYVLKKMEQYERLIVLQADAALTDAKLLDMAASVGFWKEVAGAKGNKNLKPADRQEIKAWFSLLEHEGSLQHFDLTHLKGTGAHLEDGRLVFNLGDKLLVDGELKSMRCDEVKGIYMPGGTTAPMIKKRASGAADLQKVAELAERRAWRSPDDGKILTGWLVCAFAAGILDWRPHLWVMGQSGSGKTILREKLLQPIMGGLMRLVVGDGSTIAGLRREMESTSLPVFYDEAEISKIDKGAAMAAVQGMMREATSASGGRVKAGDSHGRATVHQDVNSCFILFSTRIPYSDQADENRRMVITPSRTMSNMEYIEWERDLRALTGDAERMAGLRHHIISNCLKIRDIIRDAALVFRSSHSTDMIGREVDLLSALLGGWCFATGESIDEDVVERVRKSRRAATDPESESAKVLNAILQMRQARGKTASVGHLIVQRLRTASDQSRDEIDRELADMGVRVDPPKIYIGHTHSAVKEAVRRAELGGINIGSVLQQSNSPIVSPEGQMSFAGSRARCVSFGVDWIDIDDPIFAETEADEEVDGLPKVF